MGVIYQLVRSSDGEVLASGDASQLNNVVMDLLPPASGTETYTLECMSGAVVASSYYAGNILTSASLVALVMRK